MIGPPPTSLQVEATAAETRILLDHNRPRPPIATWKRVAVWVWIGSMLLTIFVPILFCPLGLAASLIVGTAFVIDASRSVVDRVVLRRDHLVVVTRGSMGRRRHVVPWTDLRAVALESEERGARSRDALLLRWEPTDRKGPVRVGLGRDAQDLLWMRDLLKQVQGMLTETPDDA